MELTSHIALPELTALATRDENFAALVTRQSRFVFRVAYSVLRNAQDAEDVVQDTFFKLHRSGAWQQMRDERAFLARAAWRLAGWRSRDWFRSRNQRRSRNGCRPMSKVSSMATYRPPSTA